MLRVKSLTINTCYGVTGFSDLLSSHLAFLAVLCRKSVVRLWRKTEIELELARAFADKWCAREDSNLHPLRDQILSLACLPFHHSRTY